MGTDIGIQVVLRDARTLDDVGVCRAPPPVEPGDLVSLEHGPPFRVISVLEPPPGSRVVAVLARPAVLRLVGR